MEIATQIDASQLLIDPPLEDPACPCPMEIDITKPWARLVSLSPNIPHKDLYPMGKEDNRLATYFLGRSARADFQFDQQKISNIHCSIYCEKSKTTDAYEVYIEDSSANGTFVNRSTKLTKHIRRLLHNGDEVSLINPDTNRMADGSLSDEVQRASFLITILLPHYGTYVSKPPIGALNVTNTVTRILQQGRSIRDYYDQGIFLGQGTSGQVYQCTNKQTGVQCAVKVISLRRLSATTTPADIDAILKEAQMLRHLKHTRIISLEDVFADSTNLYIVTELLHGGDLFDRVTSKRRYTEHEARLLLYQLLDAIAFLHEKKVAHRDLKIENILLVSKTNDVDIKVTDFGLAKSTEDSGGLKTFCGTPQYFAPEVMDRQNIFAAGNTTYTLSADMWSVGVILYVLLSGSLPWRDDTLFDQIAAARYDFDAPVWAKISPHAKDLINKLLVVDPSGRLTASAALEHEWFDCLKPVPMIAASQLDTIPEESSDKSDVSQQTVSTRSGSSDEAQKEEEAAVQKTRKRKKAPDTCSVSSDASKKSEENEGLTTRRKYNTRGKKK